MIVSDPEHIWRQIGQTDNLVKALEFLRLKDLSRLPDGRVEIDGLNVFALVSRYETLATTSPLFEHHRKYIDIQYIVSGEEVIGWTPANAIAVTALYDPEKDICFGTASGAWTPVHLPAGRLAVFWPEDAHAPKLAAAAPAAVMKIVMKVAV